MPLGEKIREVRQNLGISQADAAYLSQIDVSNFGKIERGAANPNINTLTRIAVALNTTVSDLTSRITAENLPPRDRKLTARDFLAARAAGELPPQSRWL